MTLVQKTLKNQKGLTLIELLAVIVILGIVAAIAVPAIGNLITKSEQKAEVSEALHIISSAKIAHASNLTPDLNATEAAALVTGSTMGWSASVLQPYISTSADFTHVVYGGNEYTIVGHTGSTVAGGGTESELATWLNDN